MEVVPISVPQGTGGPTHSAHRLPFNNRNIEEWTRLDKLTGMFEKAKIETDHWAASTASAAHKYGKVVDSRERNHPDGSIQQRQRKQMEIFQTQLPGGKMQVIRTQTVTSSSSSWSNNTNGHIFDGFPTHLNALNFKSEKTKGSIGRSGSIGTRRPPSRPRSLFTDFTSNDLLSDVTSQCQRLHNETKAQMFHTNGIDRDDDDIGGVTITEIDTTPEEMPKTSLTRQKSCSNENLNDSDDEKSSIRRTSRFRRSLQFPRNNHVEDIPEWTNGKSLKERAAEIENLLRQGSSVSVNKSSDTTENIQEQKEKSAKVKTSFVTAETLKEVRERLRKSSEDDGIVQDSSVSKVKEFVSGMEAKFGGSKVIVNGTGSLESRNSKNSTEWSQRRKSYGFEKMEDEQIERRSNIEASTDSGFGQSSETIKPLKSRLDEDIAWTRKSPLPTRERFPMRTSRNPWLSQLRGTKLIDREWFTGTPDPEVKEEDSNQKKSKKVEFCKTEVHFTEEPGRFHIVETDGKPPPNNISKRRRRPSGPENTLGLPEVKFGDSTYEKKLLTQSLSDKIEKELMELSKIVVESLPKPEETPSVREKTKLYELREVDENVPLWSSKVVLRNKQFGNVSREEQRTISDGESELQIRFRNLKKPEPGADPVGVEITRRSLPEDVMSNNKSQKVAVEEFPTYSVAERVKQVEELKSKNYSSRIDFKSGEVTVLQNGMPSAGKRDEPVIDSTQKRRPTRTDSNPTVNRFPQNTSQTTRISINIPYEDKNKPRRSSSFQSTTLVKQADIISPSKPIHEMISKFDSLARPVKHKEQRRKTMPINYKAPKEYTHADLEEELRSFTEDLDKDFKDIYEAEIESLRVKKQKSRPTILNINKYYDSDDSDLLADEEVRSYMSAGPCGSDSDHFYGAKKPISYKQKFQRAQERKEAPKTSFVNVKKTEESHYAAPPKIASIALRYEDDPLFKTQNDRWEKLSNGSSNYSDRPHERSSFLYGPSLSEKYSRKGSNSSLDTITEVGCLSKVRDLQKRSSNSSLDTLTEVGSLTKVRELQSSFRKKTEVKEQTAATLDELTKAADEILVAINGLTDDDSHLSSSDDDRNSRKILRKGKLQNLSTISEKNAVKKDEPKKPLSSRALRLLQRASSRDAMFAQRSSSEDIPANVEPIKKKFVRRPRTEIKNVSTEEKVCSRFKTKTAESAKNLRERKVEAVKESSSRMAKGYNCEKVEKTKPSVRRQLLTKADAAAEQATKCRRAQSNHSNVIVTSTSTSASTSNKRRVSKVSSRRHDATKASQAI